MQLKPIDLTQSVHALCTQYPDLIPVMEELGFKDITKPGMLATAGRWMIIPKGVALKKLDLDTIKQQLYENGFEVRG
ncbi:MAG: DUF1858 domain-containing protein [Smithellaceae bacterium]|nr:DUF1858 domain-containing protein [Smithellaceae bacterium]